MQMPQRVFSCSATDAINSVVRSVMAIGDRRQLGQVGMHTLEGQLHASQRLRHQLEVGVLGGRLPVYLDAEVQV